MTSTQTVVRTASSDIKRFLPGLYPAINALSDSSEPAGLESELIELVNLRASQINGCAYCVQYHTSNLREMGIADAKITLTVVWQEAGLFSEREQAAFAWTEAITLIAHDHAPDAAYDAARVVFSEPELVGLTAAIATINVWNRFGVAFRYAPEV